jgi:hypothetical protein
MFRRAERLQRKAAGRGVHPVGLIANKAEDLLPGSELMALIGLAGRPAEEVLDRARRVGYKRRLHAHEAEIDDAPAAVVLLPREVQTEQVRWTLRLGHAPLSTVPFGELRREVDSLRGLGASVQWTRARLSREQGAPGIDLRVRVTGAENRREFRTLLPFAVFPDAAAVTAFVREAVGEGVHMI